MVLVDASVWFVELLMGAERSNRKPDVLRRLDALTRVVSVHYGVNRLVCEHYVLQFTRLRAAGTPLVRMIYGLPATPWPMTARQ